MITQSVRYPNLADYCFKYDPILGKLCPEKTQHLQPQKNRGDKTTMLRNDELEERRLFSYQERAAALKRSHGKCACCGKSLTTKTMTMDHVIPISRGGTNDAKNMVALCYDCNELKGNLLYRPESFYISAINESMYLECQDLFHEWFDTIYKDFDLERYPLISPKFVTLFMPVATEHRMKKLIVSRQLMLEYHLVSQDSDNEVNAITGINIKELRADTNMLHFDKYKNHTVAVYAMTKISSMKYLALISVLLDKESHKLTVYMPWSDISKEFQPTAMYFFIKFLLESLVGYAHELIDTISVYAANETSLYYFDSNVEQHPLIGIASTHIHTENIKGIGNVYVLNILRHLRPQDGLTFNQKSNVVINRFVSLEDRDKLLQRSAIREEKFKKGLEIAENRYAEAHRLKKEN